MKKHLKIKYAARIESGACMPLFISPGVSIMVTPLGNLIFKKSRVVPGRLETVACGTVERGDFFFLPPIALTGGDKKMKSDF